MWWERFWSWVEWKSQQTLCQLLYDKAPGEKIPIPSYEESENPLQVFGNTHVDKNLYRWVVYVLWLQSYPHASCWFRKLQKEHPHMIPTIHRLVMTLWANQKRRKRFQWPTRC